MRRVEKMFHKQLLKCTRGAAESVYSHFFFSTFLIAKASEMKAGWERRLGGGAVPPPCPAALRPRTPGCLPGTSSRGVMLM